MAKRIGTRIAFVRERINEQLMREYIHGDKYQNAQQREGYVGGYLQALTDIECALGGFVDQNSRFETYWKRSNIKGNPND